MTSCSSTPFWYSLVAVVAQREWLDLNPPIPAAVHNQEMVFVSVLCPNGFIVYRRYDNGCAAGCR